MKFLATLRNCWLLARRYLWKRLSICLSFKRRKSTKFKYSECKTFERRFSKNYTLPRKTIYYYEEKQARETGSILPRVLAQRIDAIKFQSLGHRQTICTYKGRKFRAALIQSSRDCGRTEIIVYGGYYGLFRARHRVACARLWCVRARNAAPALCFMA